MRLKFLFFLLLMCRLSLFAFEPIKVGSLYFVFDTQNKTATIVGTNHADPNTGAWITTPASYSGDVVIPETVEYEGVIYTVNKINDEAFSYCPDLTSVIIPNTVTTIGLAVFYNSPKLTSIEIPKSVILMGGSIEDYTGAFMGSSVSYVTFGEGTTKIIDKALLNAYELTSVTIPASVNSFGKSAFHGCIKLASIIIPDGILSIGERTFSSSGLTSISIPASVTSIGDYAFSHCSSLTSVMVQCCPTSIGVGLFDDSPNLKEVHYDCEIVTKLFSGCKSIEKVIIPESVTSIAEAAFKDCTGLTSITIPASESIIGKGALDGCTNAALYVPDTEIESYKTKYSSVVKEILPIEKVTNFNLTYYIDGKEYKKVQYKYDDEIIPEAEPTRKGMKFLGWSEIPEKMPGKDVTVTGTFSWSKIAKDGVIYQVYDAENELAGVIGSDNASGEVKIVSPVEIDGINYSVTDIVDFSFKNNSDITSVVISESVRKIGDEAFYGCKNLAKIELGKGGNQIEPRAFAGIDKLTDVTIYAEDVPSTDRTAFENSYIEDYVTLHVPAGSVEKYKAAAPWKNFKEIVAMSDAGADDTDVDVITIKSYGKGTYCSDYDLDFSYTENLKAFIVTGYDHKTNTIWLTRVKSVPAGTGIIVKGTPGDYKVKRVESLSVYANFLVGTTEDKIIKDVEDGMTNFVLSKGEWYRFDGEITLPKGMAYLPLPLSKFAGTRSLTEVYEDDDKGTTGIRTIEQGTVSSEHDVWFTLQGQRVDKPSKGLYIRNGKKVVIRSTTK